MANPLSSRGWSDRDYAAAVGTLMGEAAVRGSLEDYQAIADVIANRLADGTFGKNVAGVTMNPSQFSTWSPKEKNAYQNAIMGYAAAVDPKVVDRMPKAARERFDLAQQAIADVNLTGVARGIAQGATFYDNPTVTAKLGTAGFHNQLEDKYGSIQIGAHRFSGPDLTDLPFDPVTYNGQLAAPQAAEPYFGDVLFGQPSIDPVPIGQVDLAGGLPDLTPASAGFSLPDDLPSVAPNYSDITAGTAFDQFPGFSPSAQAPVNVSDIDLNTFPGITESLYSDPLANVSAQPADWGSMPEAYGPSMSEMGTQGFHAGFDAGPYGQTPDFSAPSLEAQNNFDRQMGAVAGFNGNSWNSSDLNNEAIAARVNAELAPQAPQLATPSMDMQGMVAGDWADKFGAPQLSTPSVSPQMAAARASSVPQGDFSVPSRAPSSSFPETAPLPPSRPQEDTFSLGPFGWDDKTGLTIGGFGSPVDAIKSGLGLGMPNDAFMNGMADPRYAASYQPGFLDSTIGRPLIGAGKGALFGGLPGAAFGGLMGGTGWGNMLSNQVSDFFGGMLDHAMQGWDGYDFATHGYGAGFNARGERSPTGPNDSGSATLGDGSYGERSGTNPNNPQGIL